MRTFSCWLIANFEIAIIFLTAIIGSIAFFCFSEIENEIGVSMYLALGTILLMTFPTNRGTLQFGKYILMLVGVIILMWYVKKNGIGEDFQMFYNHFIPWFWWVFSISSVISAVLAVYTFINFDEVTSRRMLWRNSNVSLFEISLLYTLDRFCNITVSLVACTLGLVLFFKFL